MIKLMSIAEIKSMTAQINSVLDSMNSELGYYRHNKNCIIGYGDGIRISNNITLTGQYFEYRINYTGTRFQVMAWLIFGGKLKLKSGVSIRNLFKKVKS